MSPATRAAPREQRSGRPSEARGGATAKRGRISAGCERRPSAVLGATRTQTRTPEDETSSSCIRWETVEGMGASATKAGESSREAAGARSAALMSSSSRCSVFESPAMAPEWRSAW